MDIFNVMDIGLGVLTLLFLVRGLLRGLVNEIAGVVALILGIVLAGRFYTHLVPQFTGVIESPRMAAGLSYAILFVVALIIVAMGTAIVRKFLTMTMTAWIDNLLGAAIGAAKGIFVSAIVLALMQRFVPDSTFLKASIANKYIDPLIVFARSLLPAFIDASA